MADVQALNATFYTLKSRPRMVLLPATLITCVLIALIVALFIYLNWGAFGHFNEMFQLSATQSEPSEEQIGRMMVSMFSLIGMALLFAFPLYLIVAAYEAACLRWIIRGEAPGLFGLTLGVDTWRVYSVYWFWLMGQLVISTALSFLAFPVVFLTMGNVIANPEADPTAMMATQFGVQMVLAVVQYAVMIFFGVRFSPAAATSVLRKKFAFFDAWNVTRGRFWPLFGSWVLLWLIFTVAYAVIFAVTLGAVFADVIPQIINSAEAYSPETTQAILAAILTPRTWLLVGVFYGVVALASFAYSLFAYGVNARAAIAALEDGKIKPAAA